MEEMLQNLLLMGASQYPILMTVLTVIGLARIVNKPLFAILKKLVTETETKRDDEVLAIVEHSKAYRAISFILDWTASIKLPKKVVAVPTEDVATVVKPGVPTVTIAPASEEKTEPSKVS